MKKHLALTFLLFICFPCGSAYALQTLTDLTIQVEGIAPIAKNDVVRAREKAVENALEKAVMQAVTVCLSGKYEDEKMQALQSMMIGKVERYVRNYRMIWERKEQDDYTVNLNVVMALVLVRRDLLQMGFLQKEGASVGLSLKGMKKYSDFAGLKDFLQSSPQMVKSFYPCRLEWQQAHFDLIVVGSVRKFLVELENSGRYSVETRRKNQDIVEINLQVVKEVR